ncbi:hypothetical protein ADUPG1_013392 [Aduncisulcus paluster]|uniref:Uncharacterized protein n=1 Tax=Aduncisulcus paluster TaxID=2918883 RepID=A0ABQ5K2R7_9EUKA|nr:hypothetical protein ADUPG1_013392 [Aduncisulcus paluster]
MYRTNRKLTISLSALANLCDQILFLIEFHENSFLLPKFLTEASRHLLEKEGVSFAKRKVICCCLFQGLILHQIWFNNSLKFSDDNVIKQIDEYIWSTLQLVPPNPKKYLDTDFQRQCITPLFLMLDYLDLVLLYYCFLARLNSSHLKLLLVEKPVELFLDSTIHEAIRSLTSFSESIMNRCRSHCAKVFYGRHFNSFLIPTVLIFQMSSQFKCNETIGSECSGGKRKLSLTCHPFLKKVEIHVNDLIGLTYSDMDCHPIRSQFVRSEFVHSTIPISIAKDDSILDNISHLVYSDNIGTIEKKQGMSILKSLNKIRKEMDLPVLSSTSSSSSMFQTLAFQDKSIRLIKYRPDYHHRQHRHKHTPSFCRTFLNEKCSISLLLSIYDHYYSLLSLGMEPKPWFIECVNAFSCLSFTQESNDLLLEIITTSKLQYPALFALMSLCSFPDVCFSVKAACVSAILHQLLIDRSDPLFLALFVSIFETYIKIWVQMCPRNVNILSRTLSNGTTGIVGGEELLVDLLKCIADEIERKQILTHYPNVNCIQIYLLFCFFLMDHSFTMDIPRSLIECIVENVLDVFQFITAIKWKKKQFSYVLSLVLWKRFTTSEQWVRTFKTLPTNVFGRYVRFFCEIGSNFVHYYPTMSLTNAFEFAESREKIIFSNHSEYVYVENMGYFNHLVAFSFVLSSYSKQNIHYILEKCLYLIISSNCTLSTIHSSRVRNLGLFSFISKVSVCVDIIMTLTKLELASSSSNGRCTLDTAYLMIPYFVGSLCSLLIFDHLEAICVQTLSFIINRYVMRKVLDSSCYNPSQYSLDTEECSSTVTTLNKGISHPTSIRILDCFISEGLFNPIRRITTKCWEIINGIMKSFPENSSNSPTID